MQVPRRNVFGIAAAATALAASTVSTHGAIAKVGEAPKRSSRERLEEASLASLIPR